LDEGECDDVQRCSNSVEEENSTDSSSKELVLNQIKDRIMNQIGCFKESKVKSIRYGYTSVINAIKHKKTINRPVEFIRKKATKEERKASQAKGRKQNVLEVEEKKKYSGGKYSKRRKTGGTRARK
jgi:hypothetical protein